MELREGLPMLKYGIVLVLFLLVLAGCTKEQQPLEIAPPDADGDSIEDALDECANTVQGAPVGKQGCSDIQLRMQAKETLELIPLDDLNAEERGLVQGALANISFTMQESLYENFDLQCDTIVPFAVAQKEIVVALENLSCIVDNAALVNATENETYYEAVFQRERVGKIVIDGSQDPQNAFYEEVTVTCPKVTQLAASVALEKVLSAQFVLVNEAYQKMTCDSADAKEGALRNLGHSINNHDAGRYQHIVDNLGLAWGYVHECECGNPFELGQ